MSFHWPTFLFQVVNFIVLVLILWRLLWRPLRRHMQDRAQRIAEALEAVRTSREEVEAQKQSAAAALDEARQAQRSALEQARQEADTLKGQLIAEAKRAAEDERTRILERVAGDAAQREEAFLRALTPEIGRLLERLATEIAGPVDLHQAACLRLAEHLEALDDAAPQDLGTTDNEVQVESAQPSVPDRLRAAVRRLAAPASALRLREAPELVAGARVRIGDRIFDGSFHAQIHRALQEIGP